MLDVAPGSCPLSQAITHHGAGWLVACARDTGHVISVPSICRDDLFLYTVGEWASPAVTVLFRAWVPVSGLVRSRGQGTSALLICHVVVSPCSVTVPLAMCMLVLVTGILSIIPRTHNLEHSCCYRVRYSPKLGVAINLSRERGALICLGSSALHAAIVAAAVGIRGWAW